MSEWIEHDGKGMPVPGDTKVDVKFEDGVVLSFKDAFFWSNQEDEPETYEFSNWIWPENGVLEYYTITAYKIIEGEEA